MVLVMDIVRKMVMCSVTVWGRMFSVWA